MEKTTHPSSSVKLKLNLPTSWENLSDAQHRYIVRMMAAGFSGEDLKYHTLLRFAELTPLSSSTPNILAYRGRAVRISMEELAVATAAFDFLDGYPTAPRRWHAIGKAQAVDEMLYGVPFSDFLVLENLYQGFLYSKNPEALDEMTGILYPHISPKLRSEEATRVVVMLWYSALKQTFTAQYPDLFSPAGDEGSSPSSPAKVMNAMIRALTGGDVVKEEKVLAIDTHRALTELNEKAREAREFNELNSK